MTTSSWGGGGGGGGGAVRLWCCGLLLMLLSGGGGAAAQRPPAYKTLSGKAPLVIAKGGFSGVFPDSSQNAYVFALSSTSGDTTLWCDVQLTKDGVGICLRDLLMNNCTSIKQAYPAGEKAYIVNGQRSKGWFPIDYTISSLQSVILTQAIWSRTDKFDFAYLPILAVTNVTDFAKSSSVWLNIEHDIFYRQHGLNMTKYILSISKGGSVQYISSPELGFLQSISGRVNRKTKLVFRFLDATSSDPSSNQTYGYLLSNLTFIKTVASGIMVPKEYIWPVTTNNYIQPAKSIVRDAHSAGLEIYASDFANDRTIPYNYSYDPLEEYLHFVASDNFSVDGVLSEFPLTAAAAIGCFTNLNVSSKTDHGSPLIISHNGASGDYPDCTDLAYQKAVDDGADVIDCSIQMTSDGVPVCMSSINLFDTTNVQRTSFSNRASIFKDIQPTPGIFTFNLTWAEISSSDLRPKISSPESIYYLVRNPVYRNAGNFFRLSDFLTFAKDKDLSGIMIIIKNAVFMANSLGFDVVDSVTKALSDAGYNNQTTKAKEVMIQSEDSAVLVNLKQLETKYKLVYTLPSTIGDASASSLVDVKKFADAVIVERESIFPESQGFIMKETNLVKDLRSAGLAIYAQVFRNEFVSPPWDFFSDVTVEINSYVQLVNIDGIITDFPKTVRRYKMNSCTGLGVNMPSYMNPAEIGVLAQLLNGSQAQPPALAPMPVLNSSDVTEPPFPSAAPKNAPGGAANGSTPAPGASPSGSQAAAVMRAGILPMVTALFASLLI
ncbi:glycerophosphodiester phosphodiesterase GDPDL3-like [Oryza glaberrima]|uniref:glycerophosphodiester phosphodiesterase n=1 Tax=Oryza glaberrima TaxID=4538 RepID=I1QJX7_ORYGL|nr:glycerophosphodiester phosphodiesterase GDPDL3-like [Oryza glaberrima]